MPTRTEAPERFERPYAEQRIGKSNPPITCVGFEGRKLNDYEGHPIKRRHQNVSSYTLVYPRSLLGR